MKHTSVLLTLTLQVGGWRELEQNWIDIPLTSTHISNQEPIILIEIVKSTRIENVSPGRHTRHLIICLDDRVVARVELKQDRIPNAGVDTVRNVLVRRLHWTNFDRMRGAACGGGCSSRSARRRARGAYKTTALCGHESQHGRQQQQ